MRMAEKGVHLFPACVHNGTAVGQECDQLFGEYKSCSDTVTDDIISERIGSRAEQVSLLRQSLPFLRADGVQSRSKRDLTKVELTNYDLPRIVNGVHDPTGSVEKRPFSRAFSKDKVHAANRKVGAVPLTRAALDHPKVRRELEGDEEPGGIVVRARDRR